MKSSSENCDGNRKKSDLPPSDSRRLDAIRGCLIGGAVGDALGAYLAQKENDPRVPPEEHALFLSLQYRRITVRAVENLVKKYAKIVSPLKKITPHKLRSTYGTALYRETGDIYIVADVLGHRDVNTTRKHYAAITEDRRRSAADAVKLHKKEED